jgi:hypothetical protein
MEHILEVSLYSVTDLDQWSEMIIFESILITFKSSIIFRGSTVNWLEPKIELPEENLACPNPWNALLLNLRTLVRKKIPVLIATKFVLNAKCAAN